MKRIDIFDLDDTLSLTRPFSSFVTADANGIVNTEENYVDYFKKIKSLFWDKLSKNILFKKSGDYVIILNAETKRPFNGDVMQYLSDKKTDRNFEVINDFLILRAFPGFHSDPDTVGKEINHAVFHDYKSAENKMIITGRDEDLRPVVEKVLVDMGIEYPNYGLYMFPGRSQSIKEFKTDVILKSIEKEQWTEIHFYEDRQEWLHFAEGAVQKTYPDVKFVPHYISNVKDSHTF